MILIFFNCPGQLFCRLSLTWISLIISSWLESNLKKKKFLSKYDTCMMLSMGAFPLQCLHFRCPEPWGHVTRSPSHQGLGSKGQSFSSGRVKAKALVLAESTAREGCQLQGIPAGQPRPRRELLPTKSSRGQWSASSSANGSPAAVDTVCWCSCNGNKKRGQRIPKQSCWREGTAGNMGTEVEKTRIIKELKGWETEGTHQRREKQRVRDTETERDSHTGPQGKHHLMYFTTNFWVCVWGTLALRFWKIKRVFVYAGQTQRAKEFLPKGCAVSFAQSVLFKTQNFSLEPQKLGPEPEDSCCSSECLSFFHRTVDK